MEIKPEAMDSSLIDRVAVCFLSYYAQPRTVVVTPGGKKRTVWDVVERGSMIIESFDREAEARVCAARLCAVSALTMLAWENG